MSSNKKRVMGWSDEEREIYKSLWFNRTVSVDDICHILGRTNASVASQATTQGFPTRTSLEAQWRLEEIRKRLKEVVDG